MRLPNGTIWTIPIVLPVERAINDSVTLVYQGQELAHIDSPTSFKLDVLSECNSVYGTDSDSHPGVQKIKNRFQYAISGPIVSVSRFYQKEYESYQRDPEVMKALFKEKKWKKIVGFQTRNPIHRAHEYVIKSCLETVDGLLINPLAGPQKKGDIPADVRLKTYETLIQNYFNPGNVILSIYPAPMYYAGPKEAILHAIVRKNYGCTHFIVGRDHAGVGSFYDPYAAQDLAYSLEDEIGIQIIKIDSVFYDEKSKTMGSNKTMPAGCEPAEISGTKLRDLLTNNQEVPEGISRPEVLEILKKYYGN